MLKMLKIPKEKIFTLFHITIYFKSLVRYLRPTLYYLSNSELSDKLLQLLNYNHQCHMHRVTISGKAKFGTMDGHFVRDQRYGPFHQFP